MLPYSAFTEVLGITNQVIMLAHQALLPLSCFPSSVLNISDLRLAEFSCKSQDIEGWSHTVLIKCPKLCCSSNNTSLPGLLVAVQTTLERRTNSKLRTPPRPINRQARHKKREARPHTGISQEEFNGLRLKLFF